MSAFNSTFQAPIPGSSLTHKLGDLPHEKPPKYTDPNEALEYIWKQLHRPEILKQIWYLLENGGTVFAIARAILFKAAMSGIIQMNLAIAIYQTVGSMVEAIGKAKGIKVNVNPKFRDKTEDAMTDDHINSHFDGRRSGPVPHSALLSMQLPKAEDLNSSMDFLSKDNNKKPKEAKSGLLNMKGA